MPSAREVDVARPTSTVELSPQEIDSMMAEAMAVDVLLQSKRPGPFDVMLALSEYLSCPTRAGKAGFEEDSATR